MSDKYSALRAAAEKATKGEWVMSDEYHLRIRDDDGKVIASAGYADDRQDVVDAKFIAAANPATILSLLAEREADKARIAELTSGLNVANERYENRTPTEWAYNQACAAIEKHRARADNADQRIAELESRKLLVNIRQWDEFIVQHFTSCSDDYAAGWVNGRDHAQDEIRKGCATAGITLETGV